MEEWKKGDSRITPKDSFAYSISEDVIRFTEKILLEFATINPPSEGLVYWAGHKLDNQITISTCIAPNIKASRYNIGIDHYENLRVVEMLSLHKVIHIGQVHSHPQSWVGHSYTDDECAAFKVNGLLSLVVPRFAEKGMVPLHKCGVHRYLNGNFDRLSNIYVKQKFKIVNNIHSNLIDLRNGKQFS